MLADAQWMSLEPLIEACRPKGKTPPQDLRRTLSAILWRHQNGAKWRAIPADLGPWSRAAQTFIRWAHLGGWERLLLLAQERGPRAWCPTRDDISRWHQHPGAPQGGGRGKKGANSTARDEREALGRSRGGYGTQACGIADGRGRAVAFILAPGQAHELPHAVPLLMRSRSSCGPAPHAVPLLMRSRSWSACPGCRSGWWRTGVMPAMPFASTSGTWVRVRRSRPSRLRPQSPVRSGSTPTVTRSSGSGRG